ncbi:hypothetical protein [Chromobacterium amazonense]|uniref:hypothetical protein n=1 Tax=Chromobacterium amazonense TaxID=1382803 RepID=UPI0031F6377C
MSTYIRFGGKIISLQLLWQIERLLHNSVPEPASIAAKQAVQRAVSLCARLSKELLSRGEEGGTSIYLTDQEWETLGAAMNFICLSPR